MLSGSGGVYRLLAIVAAALLLAGCAQSDARFTPPIGASAPVPGVRTKTSGCTSQGGLPDPACTPGALDSRVSQQTIGGTVCVRGYTATVRPVVEATERIKREVMAAYGLTGKRLSDYELDHFIPLALGGAPEDVANLWPQPWAGDANAKMKDAVEDFLHRAVCGGTVPLVEAQRQIATDWLAVYRSRGLQPTP
jgi:hypothetical protein